jgi:hypothetical protein
MTVLTAARNWVSRVTAAATMRDVRGYRVEPDDCDELERWTRIGFERGSAMRRWNGDIAMSPGHDDRRARIPVVYLRRAITTRPAKNSAAAKMIMPRPM